MKQLFSLLQLFLQQFLISVFTYFYTFSLNQFFRYKEMQQCIVNCTNSAPGSVQKVVIDWQLVKKNSQQKRQRMHAVEKHKLLFN